MKRIYNLTFLLFFSFPVFGQNPFYDAIRLKACLDPDFNRNEKTMASFRTDSLFYADCFSILVRYSGITDLRFSDSDFFDAYFRNPFLSDDQGDVLILIPNVPQSNDVRDIPDELNLTGSNKAAPDFFVTNLADGLAKFLVKRAKEELTIAFFRKFSDQLRNNKQLNYLFPSTVDLLKVIDREIYHFNAYLEGLRERFIQDLKVLPTHLNDYLTNESIIDEIHRQIMVRDALYASQLLIDGQNPIALIRYLGSEAAIQDDDILSQIENPGLQKSYSDASAGFRMVNLISESFQSKFPDQNWVGPKEIAFSFNDPEILYLYLGLLWQQAGGIDFQDGMSMRDGMNAIAGGVLKARQFKDFVNDFTMYGQMIGDKLENLEDRIVLGDVQFIDYFELTHPVFKMLETASRFKRDFLDDNEETSNGESQRLIGVIRNLQALQFAVRQNQYVAAVGHMASVLSELLGESFTFKSELLRYAHFMATVAEAGNSDQVAQAIELFALPPGSSALKKQSEFSVAINAYTGISGGSENLEGVGSGGLMAVSAPIGFNFNKGFGNKGSLSLYVPLIDVGALAAFRFGDPDTEDLPELNFQNILAPGGYLVYGLGQDLPLSIGTGVQLGPGLRKVTGNGQFVIDEVSGWRWSVFVGVDIPIVHLYTR